MPRLLLLALLLVGAHGKGPPVLLDEEDEKAFRKQVRPLLRDFIFSKYDKFAASELSFRDLKNHLAEKLDMPYEALKSDDTSSVIEDETDKIANRCDGGEVSKTACMARFGYKEAKEEL